MVILQLVTKRQYRGAEVFAAELCSLLAGNGHSVLFAGLYEAPSNTLTAHGAENIDLNGRKSAFSLVLLLKLIRLIRKENPDIIQANGSDTLKYAVFAKLFMPRLKIVYRNISMVSAWAKEASLKRKFNQWLFKRVNRVTSVGRQSLDDLVKTYHYPPEKTKLIRRGIPQFEIDRINARHKLAKEFGFVETDPILIHIGQFSPEKNHPFLIESFEMLLTHIPNARLVFIGEGIKLNEIRTLVKSKELEKHIFFAGHREHVQELLAGADLFVLGSTIEGVPGVVLEAGMQSLPAVAVKAGGVGEVVQNENTGILIEKHVPLEFSNALMDLLNNEMKRKSLGKNAKDFVMRKYSLQQCVLEFEQLYREIAAEK